METSEERVGEMIGRINDRTKAGKPVVVYSRVSGNGRKTNGRQQALEGVRGQADSMADYCNGYGRPVLAAKTDVGSARLEKRRFEDRPGLMEAIRLCKAHDCDLAVENVYRLIRNDGNDKMQPLTAASLEALTQFAASHGVRIITRSPDGIPDSELRSFQTTRGMESSPKKAGRPEGSFKLNPEQRRKALHLARVKVSVVKIAEILSVSANTVRSYVADQSKNLGITSDVPEHYRMAYLRKWGFSLNEIASALGTETVRVLTKLLRLAKALGKPELLSGEFKKGVVIYSFTLNPNPHRTTKARINTNQPPPWARINPKRPPYQPVGT